MRFFIGWVDVVVVVIVIGFVVGVKREDLIFCMGVEWSLYVFD